MVRQSGNAKTAAKKAAKSSVTKAAKAAKTVPAAKPAAGKGARPKPAKLPARQAAKSGKRTPAAPVAPPPDLYSSLHALLHTMRLIERHDEPLCSMHDELKRTGRLSAVQHRRLRLLVDELPAEEYQADLDTLRRAVAA